MQPPPQAAPSGAHGPPPLAISRNTYRRNRLFDRRANAPVSAAAGPVQPVTDPFAFGRQVPRSEGLVMPSFSPVGFPPPTLTQASHPHGGDNFPGPLSSVPAPVSQPGSHGAFPSAAAPLLSLPAHMANSVEMHTGAERSAHSPLGQTHAMGTALGNAVGGQPGLASGPERPLSGQEASQNPGNPSLAPTTLPYFPTTQQPVPHWKPAQGGGQLQGHVYFAHPELPSPNVCYTVPQASASLAQPGPGMDSHQQLPVVPGAAQAPLMVSDAPSVAAPPNANHSGAWQNAGAPGPWPGQLPQEHFYLQPLEATYTPSSSTTQENLPAAQPQGVPGAASRWGAADADSGTVSMFFKGDEAENEEILSSEKGDSGGKADVDTFQQMMGDTYYQPLHPHQGTVAGALPPAQADGGSEAQHSFRGLCQQQELPANKHAAVAGEAAGHVGPPYENVENLECVQNQEVLPREPLLQSCSSPGAIPDPNRYASLGGASLPKSSLASHLEGGPNLESPDLLPRPVRPDSVSSNYSNLSHRSASGSARPQELGTFIQQESGKAEEDSYGGFFKQVDSSPLGADTGKHNPGKSYHSGLSQAPTPSPPKPTGVFQTSANSSFEPVRSHSLGVKPAEADHAKMVAELKESRPKQRPPEKGSAIPVASPGNLEQPPDNLETFFAFQSRPGPLAASGGAGGLLPSVGRSAGENLQALSEKKSAARVQGAVKKCESPATTLWAQNELPDFGGNVLLAPAAPAVYVQAKQPVQVVQPPEEPGEERPAPFLPTRAGNVSSENLENPPKMEEEEALGSQGSSGYASLLSSPPTEALQNQPVLILQPDQGYGLAQPVNFSLANQPSKKESSHLAKEPAVGSKPGGDSAGESVSSSATQPASLGHTPVTALPNSNFLQGPLGAPEMPPNKSAGRPLHPASHAPLNLVLESQKAAGSEGSPPELASKPRTNASAPLGGGNLAALPPGGTAGLNGQGRAKNSSDTQQPSQALHFALANPSEQSGVGGSAQGPAGQAEPGAHDPQHFYPQVVKKGQTPAESGRTTPLQPQAPQQPSFPSDPLPPGSGSTQAQSHKTYLAGPLGVNPAQPTPAYGQARANHKPTSSGQPPTTSAATGLPPSSTASGSGQLPGPPPPHEQQHPPAPPETPHNAFGPPPNPYYYYQHPYDAYSSYPSSYAQMDPRVSHLYYQEDVYSRYDPSYQMYDAAYREAGNYRYAEPERPSSRASHTSDRPSSRQGYPEDYYSRSGWNDYYANYYDYGDPSRSDRYSYDARFRDPRGYNQRYWNEQSGYQKRDPYLYENSHDRYEDHWRYDPRYASFDDDMESRRDLYGDEFDRRSVHSEHSGHSLRSSHSRQSSFSSRSQQSQLYRSNHDLTANVYPDDHQPASLRADYPYTHFSSQAPFVDSYAPQAPWPAAEQVPSRPLTPEKFSVPHTCLRFGPGGFVVKVLPNLPSEGQPALVEIHSMEMLMQHFPEQEEMRAFPGPLTKDDTHKVDVINFAQNKATRCSQNDSLIDKESSRLLWDFIILLCRQNGTVVGTDIAELLLKDHKTVWLPGKSPDEANLIDFTNEALEQVEEESGEAQLSFLTDNLLTTIDSLERETERFRELLLYGRKKDALESAMKHGLWGHALLLASKMDSRTHARVMTRFANSLPINDPLQTVYQLMSGRMPAASTCCGDEKWGDWRPHLGMVLSNLTNNMELESRTMTTMGDTLASKGLLDAAHFCYLMAQVGFGVYAKKTSKLVLIGSNQSLPFSKFATNEAIQRTEAYEYAQSLGTRPCCLYNFQVFKFIYACRLAEMGLPAQAFHYCEVISKAILRSPSYCSPVLISQLIKISSQLRLFDPQIKEKPEQELFVEPSWLVQLRSLDGQIRDGSLAYGASRSTPQQYSCSTPSSELEHVGQADGAAVSQEAGSGLDNPLLASLLPSAGHPAQSVQLMPSAPQAILDGSTTMAPPAYQDPAGAAPFCPMPPPATALCPGFRSPYGAEQMPMYPAMGLPPPGPPPQANELRAQESLGQETGQGSPQDPPAWKGLPEPPEEDFYGKMANMQGPGRRSRSASQSSAHMGLGRRSRTTSESSTHSIGRERQNSVGKQPSPPPPSIPEGKVGKTEPKKEPASRKTGATWFGWLMGKGRNEAHLPDDKNKSIVWDEKKQRWVNLDEPEEESKPPPPPPTGFPQVPQAVPSGPGGPPNNSVNIFSRRAGGSRARYVDILNPAGAKPAGAAPAPSDLFAPLAPMPIPANLLVPNPALEEQQPLEGKGAEEPMLPGKQSSPETTADLPYLNSATFPPGPELPASNPEGPQLGETPPEGTSGGTVQFYNPAQFAQSAAVPGNTRLSRIGQRKYPTLK